MIKSQKLCDEIQKKKRPLGMKIFPRKQESFKSPDFDLPQGVKPKKISGDTFESLDIIMRFQIQGDESLLWERKCRSLIRMLV